MLLHKLDVENVVMVWTTWRYFRVDELNLVVIVAIIIARSDELIHPSPGIVHPSIPGHN